MNLEKYMIPCLSKSLFGIECLGCGTQRALLLLLKGEFTAAFYMFPAIYTTVIFFFFLAFHFLDRARNYSKIIIPLAILNTVIMIIAYIYKMTCH